MRFAVNSFAIKKIAEYADLERAKALFGLWIALAIALGPALSPAQAQTTRQPTTEPQLRIEAGMHTAVIKRIATDAAGRLAVTASDDKTARVWDVASGRLLQTLRIPIDQGDEGKLYAVALSPDGRLAAVGGRAGTGTDPRTSTCSTPSVAACCNG